LNENLRRIVEKLTFPGGGNLLYTNIITNIINDRRQIGLKPGGYNGIIKKITLINEI
jgi:hypothetical protein